MDGISFAKTMMGVAAAAVAAGTDGAFAVGTGGAFAAAGAAFDKGDEVPVFPEQAEDFSDRFDVGALLNQPMGRSFFDGLKQVGELPFNVSVSGCPIYPYHADFELWRPQKFEGISDDQCQHNVVLSEHFPSKEFESVFWQTLGISYFSQKTPNPFADITFYEGCSFDIRLTIDSEGCASISGQDKTVLFCLLDSRLCPLDSNLEKRFNREVRFLPVGQVVDQNNAYQVKVNDPRHAAWKRIFEQKVNKSQTTFIQVGAMHGDFWKNFFLQNNECVTFLVSSEGANEKLLFNYMFDLLLQHVPTLLETLADQTVSSSTVAQEKDVYDYIDSVLTYSNMPELDLIWEWYQFKLHSPTERDYAHFLGDLLSRRVQTDYMRTSKIVYSIISNVFEGVAEVTKGKSMKSFYNHFGNYTTDKEAVSQQVKRLLCYVNNGVRFDDYSVPRGVYKGLKAILKTLVSPVERRDPSKEDL
ncbi:MAG: hypothetical protein VW378_07815 [bacterium]